MVSMIYIFTLPTKAILFYLFFSIYDWFFIIDKKQWNAFFLHFLIYLLYYSFYVNVNMNYDYNSLICKFYPGIINSCAFFICKTWSCYYRNKLMYFSFTFTNYLSPNNQSGIKLKFISKRTIWQLLKVNIILVHIQASTWVRNCLIYHSKYVLHLHRQINLSITELCTN